MKVSYFQSHEQIKHGCTTLRTNVHDCFQGDTLEKESCFKYYFFNKKVMETIKNENI